MSEDILLRELKPFERTILSILGRRRLKLEDIRRNVNSIRISLRSPPVDDKMVLDSLKKMKELNLVKAIEIRDTIYWELTEKGKPLA